MVDALRLLAQARAGSLLSSFEGLAAPATHPGGQKDRPVSVSENRAIELGQFLMGIALSRLDLKCQVFFATDIDTYTRRF